MANSADLTSPNFRNSRFSTSGIPSEQAKTGDRLLQQRQRRHPRSLWEKHHYDETLTGLEDLAWAKWAKEQGHTISYVAEAEIIHVHNETPHGVYNRYRREAMACGRSTPKRISICTISAPDDDQYFQRPVSRRARRRPAEKSGLDLLVPLHAIPRDTHRSPRDQSGHAAVA